MDDEFLTRAESEETARFIASRTKHQPTIGIILGSGLNALAEVVEDADRIPYEAIPRFPVSTVAGHSGELVIGKLSRQTVCVMRGRVHYYEGYSMQHVTFPIRVMRAQGVNTLVVTNAAGGLNQTFRAGDLMLITDQINLAGMTGLNPLRGPNDASIGPRFPDIEPAYDPQLREIARQVARDAGLTLREGVYIMLAGPNYETAADVRFLRVIGADAVGMSTVPEVIVARHGGMRVLGLSLISNVVGGGASHEEVLAAGRAAGPKLVALIHGVLARLP
jgi:purine-nucleoside phosphorylase